MTSHQAAPNPPETPRMPAIVRPLDLDALTLESGAHDGPQGGGCIMEWSAYLAGEPWSDHPACVSPVIAAFCRSWNDTLDTETRNRLLKPYVVRVIGTATGPEDEKTRAWLATDWLVRVQTPAWLELAGLTARAAELRALPPLTSAEIAVGIQSVLDHAQHDAYAARAATWDATGDATWDATWAAAWAAARDAAWDATWAAAWDAAGDAAWAAAGDATRAATWLRRGLRRGTRRGLRGTRCARPSSTSSNPHSGCSTR